MGILANISLEVNQEEASNQAREKAKTESQLRIRKRLIDNISEEVRDIVHDTETCLVEIRTGFSLLLTPKFVELMDETTELRLENSRLCDDRSAEDMRVTLVFSLL